ncbi:MAG: hypothetical protein OIF32_11330 [Campylobacterales bacterium]|nr:hypothetical protein [Campylobacterales bacterium]
MKKQQLSLFGGTIEEKIERSTNTLQEIRIPLFAPMAKIPPNSNTAKKFKLNNNIRTVETTHGKADVRNRILTQTHQDLMIAIHTHKDKLKKLEDGSIAIYFSKYKILKALGKKIGGISKKAMMNKIEPNYRTEMNISKKKKKEIVDGKTRYVYETELTKEQQAELENRVKEEKEAIKKGKRDYSYLGMMLKEISDVNVDLLTKDGDTFSFHIIENVAFSQKENSFGIILSKAYVNFYMNDYSISFKDKFDELVRIKNALVKAIIINLSTHKNVNCWTLESILDLVGYPINSTRDMTRAKKEIRDNIDEFKKFNMAVNPTTLTFEYRQDENITLIPPLELE